MVVCLRMCRDNKDPVVGFSTLSITLEELEACCFPMVCS
ncbi:Uncharacterised protein [Chlamydia abortus]|nr:Uncharacterised protein [Chlamydia abortus]